MSKNYNNRDRMIPWRPVSSSMSLIDRNTCVVVAKDIKEARRKIRRQMQLVFGDGAVLIWYQEGSIVERVNEHNYDK